MKINTLTSYDIFFKNRLSYNNTNNSNTVIKIPHDSVSIDTLENYDSAKTYYNKKLNNDGKLFDNEESFMNVFRNNKARNALFNFLREHAQEELVELNSKSNLSEAENNKKEGLKPFLNQTRL